ncbi:MAG TPA: prepilin peptidase [Novosphingobium sp.]|nr:prepilin peptidase [Novosphingobium sp.]HQA16958.1 prepilin peptidase [Novosphingobium sp.]
MSDVEFRYLLLGGLAIALAIAAVTDLRRRQIDNWLNAAIALCAPLYWWASNLTLWPDVAWQIGICLIVFFGFAVIFARGGMGGGDVKLLAALALWLPPMVFFSVLFLTSLVGGAMSMVAGARNLSLGSGDSGKRSLAFSATTLWVLGSCYIAWVMNGGKPLDATALLPAAIVKIALFALLGLTAVGAIVVSRNQKSRLPVPYGLAISTGGLLVIFTQFLPSARAAFAASGLG